MWDQRYGGKEYAYGTEPNEFLVAMAPRLPMGRVLCLGEGEGRNAVWLAGQGYDVTAVDASRVGLEKAERLAAERGVTMTTVHSNLAAYDIEPGIWDGILSVFCHLPTTLRADVHVAEEGLGGDADVRKQTGIATATCLAFDPGHESGPDAMMLMGVVDVKAVDLPCPSQLNEADGCAFVLRDQDPITPEAP